MSSPYHYRVALRHIAATSLYQLYSTQLSAGSHHDVPPQKPRSTLEELVRWASASGAEIHSPPDSTTKPVAEA